MTGCSDGGEGTIPAVPAMMKFSIISLAAFLCAACGSDGLLVQGTPRAELLPKSAEDSLYVWLDEGGTPAAFREGGFTFREVRGGALVLRIGDGEEALGRLELSDLPEEGAVVLDGLRLDRSSGLVFPDSVRLDGVGIIRVNGLRMASSDALPEEIETNGAVLSVARSGDALLFRPADEALPDLRVVVTPGTETVTPDGDPTDPSDLEAGDTLSLSGTVEAGLVIARRLVVARRVAVREATGGRAERDDDDDREDDEPPTARYDDDRKESRVESAQGSSESEPRVKKRERGKRRGKGKGG